MSVIGDEVAPLRGSLGEAPLCKQVKVVAPTGSTVIILGETGTGKELIARAIHNLRLRRDRPFIKVNWAAKIFLMIPASFWGGILALYLWLD